MRFVYILRSLKTEQLYIGYTNNPKERLRQHNAGSSYHTKKYAPWKLVYLEGYANEEDAKNREKKLKQFGKVYAQLKRRVWRGLKS